MKVIASRRSTYHVKQVVSVNVDLPRESGQHELRNQEVFNGKRKQTDAGCCAKRSGWH